MKNRSVVFVLAAFLAGCVLALGLVLADRAQIAPLDPAPTSQDRLPDSFDQLVAAIHDRTPPTAPPTTTTTAPRRKVRAASTRAAVPTPTGDIWWALAGCETGGTYNQRATSSTGRYLGYFQFDLDSWRRAGGSGDPRDHTYDQQLAVAQNWQRLVGWGAWPHCSRKLGLR